MAHMDPRDTRPRDPRVTAELRALRTGRREYRTGWSRAVGVIFAVAVIGVLAFFGFVVWRAISDEAPRLTEAEVPVIVADPSETRVRPDDPGGMEVPDQDMLIHRSLEEGESEPVVERLLPPPEEPAARPASPPPSPPVVAEDVADVEAQIPASVAEPEPAAEPDSPPQSEPEVTQTVVAPSPPPPPPLAKAEPEAAAPPDTLADPPPDPPVAAAGGAYRIQLASFRDRDAVDRGWKAFLAKAPVLLVDLIPDVQEVDLGPERGTFYRLRAGPLRSREAADKLCELLGEVDLECLVVAP
jgi:cell division septation protein DedD